MKIQTIEYYFREVLLSMIRKRWMTFASIGTVAVSLFVLGVFLILVMNMNKMASSLESQVQISVYINDELPEAGRKEIERMTRDMKSVTAIEYVPREKALKILQERLGENKKILDALGESNPLPNSFLVTVGNAEDVKKTAALIADLYGVEEVKYGQDVAANLFELTHLIRFFGLILMALLLFATVFIISNTIRLTVFARRKEIAIMKYVGATDWFIRWPFILEGVGLGIIGGGVSAIILRSFYSAMITKIYESLAFFPMVEQYPFMNYLTVALIVAGIFIGILGSTVSLKRFMEV
ncbi:MAG: permease-like cell division protein FtsX [Selenomonadaceae bacterium]|nr:permease-like cell division protein FtsX [Selenomonadaceae bacterium]MBQ7722773.1 permease-like cell division protein FtsX [Selenomonadaceae bacterium]